MLPPGTKVICKLTSIAISMIRATVCLIWFSPLKITDPNYILAFFLSMKKFQETMGATCP